MIESLSQIQSSNKDISLALYTGIVNFCFLILGPP
jgi:hypothetical protein